MELVDYELAKKLKEKGYPQVKKNTLAMYDEYGYWYSLAATIDEEYSFEDFDEYDYVCPTISQVLKWLREEKKIFMTINIVYCYEDDENPFPTNPKMKPILKGYYYGVWNLDNLNDKNGRSENFESPELAALAGIEYCLDNLI